MNMDGQQKMLKEDNTQSYNQMLGESWIETENTKFMTIFWMADNGYQITTIFVFCLNSLNDNVCN